jgi:hypothetical protein
MQTKPNDGVSALAASYPSLYCRAESTPPCIDTHIRPYTILNNINSGIDILSEPPYKLITQFCSCNVCV